MYKVSLILLALAIVAGVSTLANDKAYADVEFKLWEYNTPKKAIKDIQPAMEQFREQVCYSYEMQSVEEYDDGYIIIVHVGKLTYEIYYSDINESMYYDRYKRK